MIGVSSACTNPILYGFLNENFLKEFNLLCPILGKLTTVRPAGNIIGSKKEEKTNLLTPNRQNISASTTPLLQMKTVSPLSFEPTKPTSHPLEALPVQDLPISSSNAGPNAQQPITK